jgi:hypothetical protein
MRKDEARSEVKVGSDGHGLISLPISILEQAGLKLGDSVAITVDGHTWGWTDCPVTFQLTIVKV